MAVASSFSSLHPTCQLGLSAVNHKEFPAQARSADSIVFFDNDFASDKDLRLERDPPLRQSDKGSPQGVFCNIGKVTNKMQMSVRIKVPQSVIRSH